MKKLYIIITILFLVVVSAGKLLAQQNVTVKGTVVEDANKKGLHNVTIYLDVKPLKTVGFTDSVGKFAVDIPANSRLIFHHLGYVDEKAAPIAGKRLIVFLKTKRNDLQEIVVVGYQSKTHETTTGSIVTITQKDIQDVPASNVIDLLQGKVAGLNIQNNNGTPGAVGTINIRGIANVNVVGSGSAAYLTPSSPLFVIDGVPVDMTTGAQYGFDQAGPGISPLSLIPTEDIAEIEVLKDAEATSLYGSKGAYGVILITTKRGKSSVPIIQYIGNYYVSLVPSLRTVLGGRGEREERINQIMQYDTTVYKAINTINSTPMLADSLNAYYNNSTNWQSYFYRPTVNETQNLNISGGSQTFNYKVNTGLYDQSGIIANTGFTRYSLDMNMQYQPTKKFTLFVDVSTSLGRNSKGSGNSLLQTGVATAANTSSLLPPPSLYTASDAALAASSIDDNNKTGSIVTNLQLSWQPVKGLMATSVFGYTYNTATEDTFTPGILNNNNTTVYAYGLQSSSLYLRNGLAYNYTLAKDHNFSIFVFDEVDEGTSNGNTITQVGTPNDQIQGPTGYNYTLSSGTDNYTAPTRSLGYSSAFSYNYKQKYVLDLNYRLDGTSTSGPDQPWTKSPGAGVRWNFNKEKWFAKNSWLDNASLRVTWGKNIIPTGTIYDVYGQYQSDPSTYNNQPTTSLNLTTVPNQYLVPSVTTQWDEGIDLGFLNGKLSLSFDTYYKQNDFQLSSTNIATYNAFQNISTNQTSVVDYGYELSVSLRPLSNASKFKWTLSFNVALDRDVLTQLPNQVRQIIIDGGDTGQPIINRLGASALTNYLLDYKGVYKSTANVPVDPITGLRYRVGANGTFFQGGDPIWADINGDYVLDQNDFVLTGNAVPAYTGGMSSYLQYGKWSFTINFSYTAGRDVLNDATAALFQNYSNPTGTGAILPISNYSFWTAPGQTAKYPNPYDYTRSSLVNPFQYDQTAFQEDGSYLTITSATLSYNLEPKFAKKFGVTSARIYLTGGNIYTFTHYSGPDPQLVSALGRDVSGGYPSAHNYTIGLNVQF